MGGTSTHLAVDIGTSTATCVRGRLGPRELSVRTVHRFESGLLDDLNRKVWDLAYLEEQLRAGLTAAANVGPIESVAIDATAAGFGFLADGEPLATPAREGTDRPDGISHRAIFHETGHRRLPLTYYYQATQYPERVARADTLLLAPQLLSTLLGADPAGELSYAVSAGLGNARRRSWATTILRDWGLRTDLLPALRAHGASIGRVDPAPDGCGSTDEAPRIRIVPGHDTSAAVAAIPFTPEESAFVSTGSWFIPGFEVDRPVVADPVFDMGAENVAGVAGTSRLVRNFPGFSVWERCRETWADHDHDTDYASLIGSAREAPAFRTLVDTTDARVRRGNPHPDPLEGIEAFCATTDQPMPASPGATTRTLLESLAGQSAVVLERLADIADRPIGTVRLVGGGARNELLCQWIADAIDRPVLAGAPEATALGNLLGQAVGAGTLASYAAGRTLVDRSVTFARYEPRDVDEWAAAKDRLATWF